MSAYTYIHPKPFHDCASTRASTAATMNRVSPDTTPEVHSWRDASRYVDDKRDIQTIKTNMTLFPFSYDEPTLDADGSFSVNVSPKKEVLPNATVLKEATPPIAMGKKTHTLVTAKKMPKETKHHLINNKRASSFHHPGLFDLYMAHPQLADALRRQFPDLHLPSATMQRSGLAPSRLFQSARKLTTPDIPHQKEKTAGLSFLATSTMATATTCAILESQVATESTPRPQDYYPGQPFQAKAKHHSDNLPDSASSDEFRQLQHPYHHAAHDPMWHSEFDEQLLNGGIFSEHGDFFSALDQIELDQQMPWVQPSACMW